MPESSVKHVALVSGPIASGKTTLSRLLAARFGFCVVSTRELLAQVARNRRALQSAGASFDDSTGGRWVRDGLLRLQSQSPAETLFVVDSVRTLDQVRWVRETFGESVKHIHLTASLERLSGRYHSRFEGLSYNEVVGDLVEQKVVFLALSADLVIDTESLDPDSVVDCVADNLGLRT